MPNLLQEEEKAADTREGCGHTRRYGVPSQWGAGEVPLGTNWSSLLAGEAILVTNGAKKSN